MPLSFIRAKYTASTDPSDAIEELTRPELVDLRRTKQLEMERIDDRMKQMQGETDKDAETIKAKHDIRVKAKRELEKGKNPAGNCVVMQKQQKSETPVSLRH